MTLIYDITRLFHVIGDKPAKTSTRTYRLTYTSRDSWIEEIIAAPDIQTRAEAFSDIGSYQKIEDGQYITYDAVTGDTTIAPLDESVSIIPRSRLYPKPIAMLKKYYDPSPEKVATTSRVCFNDDCEINAEGWRFMEGNRESIYADDARGIPLKLGDFVIKEVLVHGARQPVPVSVAPR